MTTTQKQKDEQHSSILYRPIEMSYISNLLSDLVKRNMIVPYLLEVFIQFITRLYSGLDPVLLSPVFSLPSVPVLPTQDKRLCLQDCSSFSALLCYQLLTCHSCRSLFQ